MYNNFNPFPDKKPILHPQPIPNQPQQFHQPIPNQQRQFQQPIHTQPQFQQLIMNPQQFHQPVHSTTSKLSLYSSSYILQQSQCELPSNATLFINNNNSNKRLPKLPFLIP